MSRIDTAARCFHRRIEMDALLDDEASDKTEMTSRPATSDAEGAAKVTTNSQRDVGLDQDGGRA